MPMYNQLLCPCSQIMILLLFNVSFCFLESYKFKAFILCIFGWHQMGTVGVSAPC